MINLFKFYEQNVKNDEYYYRFFDDLVTHPHRISDEIKTAFDIEENEDYLDFEIFDEDEAIEKFKGLCEPNLDISSDKNKRMFYYLCFYLYKNGYVIKEFPRLLSRPPEDPYEFTYNDIRNKILSLNMDRNGTVPYIIRRKLVANLTFEKKSSIVVEDDIDTIFKRISTRSATFESMAIDEKLKEIANCIEFMLREDDKYKEINYNEVAFEYINNEIVKGYRKKIQCFRHASGEAIKEREKLTEAQKEFLIDYGITIIKVIYQILNK